MQLILLGKALSRMCIDCVLEFPIRHFLHLLFDTLTLFLKMHTGISNNKED